MSQDTPPSTYKILPFMYPSQHKPAMGFATSCDEFMGSCKDWKTGRTCRADRGVAVTDGQTLLTRIPCVVGREAARLRTSPRTPHLEVFDKMLAYENFIYLRLTLYNGVAEGHKIPAVDETNVKDLFRRAESPRRRYTAAMCAKRNALRKFTSMILVGGSCLAISSDPEASAHCPHIIEGLQIGRRIEQAFRLIYTSVGDSMINSPMLRVGFIKQSDLLLIHAHISLHECRSSFAGEPVTRIVV